MKMDYETEVWNLRKKFEGMKNINKEKMEKNTKKYEEIKKFFNQELDEHVMMVEVTLDWIKYLWKCTLREYLGLQQFVKCEETGYKFIKTIMKDLSVLSEDFEWLEVQVIQFKEDMNKLVVGFEEILSQAPHVHSTCDQPLSNDILNNPMYNEYITSIKFRLRELEKMKCGKEKTENAIETIVIACDFVVDFNHQEKFKKVVIEKIEEFIVDPQMTENQKEILQTQLKRIVEPSQCCFQKTKCHLTYECCFCADKRPNGSYDTYTDGIGFTKTSDRTKNYCPGCRKVQMSFPSEYNIFMSKKIREFRDARPELTHKGIFQLAAKEWLESKRVPLC